MAEVIERMRAALKAAEEMGPAPPSVYRLHPEDYEALRRACAPHLTRAAPGSPDSFGGVRLIKDEAAPRLPRSTA